mmetsp:Transcript_58529/g.125777  ORF Transcript_58529/g.125777 Transcript_58529/m.125777 type:complete len:201 (+) Transcript_58529:114-716(+)
MHDEHHAWVQCHYLVGWLHPHRGLRSARAGQMPVRLICLPRPFAGGHLLCHGLQTALHCKLHSFSRLRDLPCRELGALECRVAVVDVQRGLRRGDRAGGVLYEPIHASLGVRLGLHTDSCGHPEGVSARLQLHCAAHAHGLLLLGSLQGLSADASAFLPGGHFRVCGRAAHGGVRPLLPGALRGPLPHSDVSSGQHGPRE